MMVIENVGRSRPMFSSTFLSKFQLFKLFHQTKIIEIKAYSFLEQYIILTDYFIMHFKFVKNFFHVS